MNPQLRVGIGGWTFEPWRNNFYPPGLAHAKELTYASRQLTAIEVNGTFYSTFKPTTFAKWRDETPEDFVFSLKAHRFTTHRKVLATAGEGINNFIGSGLAELGGKLGPIVWQFMPTKAFDAEDTAAFLKLLPREVQGRELRHVLDVRHPSFATEQYLDLLRAHGCTTVYTDSDKFPGIAHALSELAYLRLMRSRAELPTGYPESELATWVQGAQEWVGQSGRHQAFVFFINGAKERAPAAAQAFLKMLQA
ncbi:DUF72 domain-containing protein [Caenimonas sedimenti]|uniref:DUF72 domain-containing protein n=1 Tax=Caenimonas sedimenti TaxID=2596921 RepID=A0A562ZRP4_9BURK|nr:DUF72 domain-containing protein [Caenimonas sedimenti]TWO70834.1 DUF72 domain-containing protein [Caenimonas sedimenti]